MEAIPLVSPDIFITQLKTKCRADRCSQLQDNGKANISQCQAVSVEYGVATTIDYWVSLCLRRDFYQNHLSLWDLARARLDYLYQTGLAPAESIDNEFFRLWNEQNPFLDPDQTFADYRIEFEQAIKNVKYPYSLNPLEVAKTRAVQPQPPAELKKYQDKSLSKLVCLCRELQRFHPPFIDSKNRDLVNRLRDAKYSDEAIAAELRHQGFSPFYLSSDCLEEYLGKDSKTIWRWLVIRLKQIAVIQPGKKGKRRSKGSPSIANEYFYLLDIEDQ